MKKKVVSKFLFESLSIDVAVMVMFIFLGIVAGAICCFSSDASYSTSILIEDDAIVSYSFFRTLFNFSKYPLIIFLLGFTILGMFIIPLVVFFKGFFLSFSISSIFKFSAHNCFRFAFATFGMQVLISVPCILFLSAISFEFSKNFTGPFSSKTKQITPVRMSLLQYFIIFLFLLFILLIFSFLDTLITPKLISKLMINPI